MISRRLYMPGNLLQVGVVWLETRKIRGFLLILSFWRQFRTLCHLCMELHTYFALMKFTLYMYLVIFFLYIWYRTLCIPKRGVVESCNQLKRFIIDYGHFFIDKRCYLIKRGYYRRLRRLYQQLDEFTVGFRHYRQRPEWGSEIDRAALFILTLT